MSTIWNPSDKSTHVTLANNNLYAVADSTGGGVRATTALSDGTYFEITCEVDGYPAIGIADTTTSSLDVIAPNMALLGRDGDLTHIDLLSITAAGYDIPAQDVGTVAEGDIIGIAYKSGKVYFSLNGTWMFGGDPVAQTGGYTPPAATYYPYCYCSNNGAILNPGPSTNYSPPSGYSTLDSAETVTDPPSNTSIPTISGSPYYGQTLTASTGSWDNSPTSYSYQWNRSGSPISGATSSTYIPASGDVGSTLTVTVTATNSIGLASSTSSTTSTITFGPLTTTITTTGSGSYTFTSTDLPNGSGTIDIEAWGGGAPAGRRARGSGGGAYANTPGLSISTGDILYWSVATGTAGKTTNTATSGANSWIRINTNSAPSSNTDGAMAVGGSGGSNTVNGAGGTTAASIGTNLFAGGAGSNTGTGTTLRGGGGGGAGSGGAGGNASGATGGAAGTPNGGAGGTSTTTATGGSGSTPGGGGGSTSSASGTGGAGAQGQIQYTYTPSANSGSSNISATSASTLSNISQSSHSNVTVSGSSTKTITAITASVSSKTIVAATSSSNVSNITSVATGTVAFSSLSVTSSSTLSNIIQSASVNVISSFVSNVNIGNITSVDATKVIDAIVSSVTLNNLSSSGNVNSIVSGSVAQTFADITSVETSSGVTSFRVNSTLDDVTSTGNVLSNVTANATNTFDNITQNTTSVVIVNGSVSSTLDDITSDEISFKEIDATVASSIGDVTQIAVISGSAELSLFYPDGIPDTDDNTDDPSSIQLGVKFKSSVSGFVNGIRFYKGIDNAGPHDGFLWALDGTLLATCTFDDETSTGWQTALFTDPVAIDADTTYIAAYYAPSGNYASTSFAFNSEVTSGVLTALSDTESGGNGVFLYGSTPTIPNNSYHATNYFVDVVFALPQIRNYSSDVIIDNFSSVASIIVVHDIQATNTIGNITSSDTTHIIVSGVTSASIGNVNSSATVIGGHEFILGSSIGTFVNIATAQALISSDTNITIGNINQTTLANVIVDAIAELNIDEIISGDTIGIENNIQIEQSVGNIILETDIGILVKSSISEVQFDNIQSFADLIVFTPGSWTVNVTLGSITSIATGRKVTTGSAFFMF